MMLRASHVQSTPQEAKPSTTAHPDLEVVPAGAGSVHRMRCELTDQPGR
jgi:hypothetical protein